ncbi:Marine sediment metagenome DNA, contig: S01H1_L07134 OS=marine sediment metagenome GN=S01H1_16961 PE=4 SV=1: Abhydrolase_6 [Gemmata massiliana]|uniref:AB hydrolase-1 domain-containing protein n=1 Tax=Gemmata massiliana TaxID=1210884 RepID=A0A6P2DDK2_9BACT|nr:alpha/beta hydrolase [Gemmata massiliana]VTR97492.1 Marine sediment metagenome DNA, contig: S01H1_L07134 OS=marine sediment metagenome GN=S01H1_16961 PE=4 SV=1: Abhydrolase_6 [Gemmata massiliana]
MNLRFIGVASSIASLFLASTAIGDEPVKKTVKASDGLSIACDVRGKGDTTLVFLHGWGGDREYWKNQADAFAAEYEVVTVDQAGHGASGKDRKAWTVDALAGDVESVVKDLGLKRVILVGHSMGGPVSLLAAKRLPGTVVAVVGVDTLQDAELKRPEELIKSLTTGLEKDFKGMVGGMFGAMLAEKSDAKLKDWLGDKAASREPAIAIALMKDLFSLDQKKVFKDAGVPVRCINSAGGYQFFTPTAVETNKKYADFDAVTISDVGHYPMLEKPKEFNEKLQEVLKGLAAKK